MSMICRTPASPTRYLTARYMNARFSRAIFRTSGTRLKDCPCGFPVDEIVVLAAAKSARGAVPVFRPVRFPGPLPEPAAPITEQRALRKPHCSSPCAYHTATFQGEGIAAPRYRYRVVLIDPVWSSLILPAEGHHPPLQYRRRRAF